MATDFSYGKKQILSSGPFKPSGKNMPVDARTRVEVYADIESIPNPFIGMRITVLADETNSNKMTDYIVKSLKANASGIADMAINEVVRYVDYLGVSGGSSGGGTGAGLTTEQAQQLQVAYEHSQTEHFSGSYNDLSDKPIIPTQTSELENNSGYLTSIPEEYITETELDAKGYLTSHQDISNLQNKTDSGLTTTNKTVVGAINELKTGIDNAQLGGNIDTSTLASDLSLSGTSLQLKNSSGALIGSVVTLPSGGSTTVTGGNVVFTTVNLSSDTFTKGSATEEQPAISVVVDKNSLTVNEDSSVQLKVNIDNYLIDNSNTTLTLSVNNSYCTVSPSTLTFNSSNYNTEQIVTVTGAHLSSDYTNKTSVITINNSSGNNKTVNVTIVNIDIEDTNIPNITLSTSNLSVNENSTATFEVTLDKAPESNVTVNLSTTNGNCTLSNPSLTFTTSNYNIVQTVTVTGVHDESSYTNKNDVITLSADGLTSKSINVTITNIDEEPVIPNIVLSNTTLSVNEDATNTFTVSLDNAPSTDTTVSLSLDNEYCSLDKNSLTFTSTNYSTPQTVTVTGVHDESSYSNKNSIITLSSSGLTSKTVNVTIVNIDQKQEESAEEALVYWFQANEVPAGTTDVLLPNKVSGINSSDLGLTILADIDSSAYTGTWLKLDRTDGETGRYIKNSNKAATVIGTTDSYSMEYIAYSIDSPIEGWIGAQAISVKNTIQVYGSSSANSSINYMIRSNGSSGIKQSEKLITKSTINHVVLTYNHDTGTHNGYFNGKLIHTNESGVFNFGNFISFNASSANSTSYLYMLKLYRKALNQDEVTANYTSANIASIPSPV